MSLRREIFREYDIRGIAGRDLTPESVEQIGRGIGTVMQRAGKRRITVGRDCRPSSSPYRDALGKIGDRLRVPQFLRSPEVTEFQIGVEQ
jgi:phosphomannomutase